MTMAYLLLHWISSSIKKKKVAIIFFFRIVFIYLFLERGEGKGEREGETHQGGVAPHVPPTEDLVGHPGTCPDWELNW